MGHHTGYSPPVGGVIMATAWFSRVASGGGIHHVNSNNNTNGISMATMLEVLNSPASSGVSNSVAGSVLGPKVI